MARISTSLERFDATHHLNGNHVAAVHGDQAEHTCYYQAQHVRRRPAALSQSQAWPATLAFAQLARRGHTPFRLMRFLEDAHDRHVLREVGTVYQFRHARLQDRLAAAPPRPQPAAASRGDRAGHAAPAPAARPSPGPTVPARKTTGRLTLRTA